MRSQLATLAAAAAFLSTVNLSQYETALAEQGYDDLLAFKAMSPAEIQTVCAAVAMKPGHQGKFRQAVQGLQQQQRFLESADVNVGVAAIGSLAGTL